MRIVNTLFLLVCAGLIGCAPVGNLGVILGGGGVERVDGSYHMELIGEGRYPLALAKPIGNEMWYRRQIVGDPGIATGYYYTLNEPRFIRYIQLNTIDPVKNLDIYVRVGDGDWKMARQLKEPVDSSSRIDINMRACDIRVVQKTVGWDRLDFVKDFDVYVQKK